MIVHRPRKMIVRLPEIYMDAVGRAMHDCMYTIAKRQVWEAIKCMMLRYGDYTHEVVNLRVLEMQLRTEAGRINADLNLEPGISIVLTERAKRMIVMVAYDGHCIAELYSTPVGIRINSCEDINFPPKFVMAPIFHQKVDVSR